MERYWGGFFALAQFISFARRALTWLTFKTRNGASPCFFKTPWMMHVFILASTSHDNDVRIEHDHKIRGDWRHM